MAKKVSRIKAAVEEVLIDFAKTKPDWEYSIPKKSFIHKISKDMDIWIMTGFSSKVDFVDFDFGISVTHKIVKKLYEIKNLPSGNYCLLLVMNQIHWIPRGNLIGGMTVYNPRWGDFSIFEEAIVKRGETSYTHLDQFPKRLAEVFAMAEAAIKQHFDISSENAMFDSFKNLNPDMFDSNRLLDVHLLMDNPAFYDVLVARYGSRFYVERAQQQLELYRQGKYPKWAPTP